MLHAKGRRRTMQGPHHGGDPPTAPYPANFVHGGGGVRGVTGGEFVADLPSGRPHPKCTYPNYRVSRHGRDSIHKGQGSRPGLHLLTGSRDTASSSHCNHFSGLNSSLKFLTSRINVLDVIQVGRPVSMPVPVSVACQGRHGTANRHGAVWQGVGEEETHQHRPASALSDYLLRLVSSAFGGFPKCANVCISIIY